MPRVLNKHHAGVPAGAVYIGRGSKWGNLSSSAATGTVRRSSQNTSAGSQTSMISCAHSMNFEVAISCADVRRGHAMEICCCGSQTPRVTYASRGGAR